MAANYCGSIYRARDEHNETAMTDFLMRYLFERLTEYYPNIQSIRQVNDFPSQVQGVDLIIETDQGPVTVDIKAQLHYVNRNLPTQALELEFTGFRRRLGWFLSEKVINDAYLFVFPNSYLDSDPRKTDYNVDDFTNVEALLISKRKLKEKLAEVGFSEKDLLETWLPRIKNTGEYRTNTANPDIHFTTSTFLAEKPINMIVSKSFLRKVAECEFIIDKEGIQVNDPVTHQSILPDTIERAA